MDGDKTSLRRLWRDRLAQGDAADLILPLKTWATPRFDVVLGTLPLSGEPDLTAFYRAWLEAGRRLALARTNDAGMDFAFVDNLSGPWKSRRGLTEPLESAKPWRPGPSTLVVVPGLAFALSPEGVIRLGRGGGYFDRWLAVHADDVTTLGVGFPGQLTDTLPREPHDVLLDGYLDSQGFHGLEPK